MIGSLSSAFRLVGIDLSKGLSLAREMPRLVRDYREYSKLHRATASPLALGKFYPCVSDRIETAGVAEGAYFHQDLLVAQRVFERGPRRHIDVGSRVDGFVAHVASFRSIDVIDIRPCSTTASNINFINMDLMAPIPTALAAVTDSLSCLHALEHFGLGRYGDKIDPAGHIKALRNLVDMLEPGGTLYLSVPIGPSRVEFNAHRVFSVDMVLSMVPDTVVLTSLSYVDDAGYLVRDARVNDSEARRSFGCVMGCGIFEFTKT